MSCAKKVFGSNISLSLHGARSDGYRKSSDLEYSGADVTSSYESNDWFVKWNIGLINKRFGAGYFFAPYPAFEKTLTVQSGFNATRMIDEQKIIRFRIGSRGHGDDFLIKKEDLGSSEDYHNTHYNRTYSFAAEYLSDIYDNMFFLVGAETEFMGITSGSLGNHSDSNNSVYGEYSATVKKSVMSVSIRFDNGTREKNIFSPGFGIVVPLSNSSRFKIRAEKSFRLPTYTDLYYESHSNKGNPSLKSEHSSSINTGYDLTREKAEFGVSYFIRETTDAIDWVRDNNTDIWTVENHGRLVTNGVEMKCLFAILENWNGSVYASVLNQSVKERKGIESKYTLNPLSKSFSVTITGQVIKTVKCAVITKFEEQLHGQSRTPVSIRLSSNFGSINTVISARNVLNEQYEEIPGLPAPGRWLDVTMEYSGGNQ
jgi:iron complex outermembrane receptor protein